VKSSFKKIPPQHQKKMAQSSRISLHLHALWIRFVTGIFSILDLYWSPPKPPKPAFKVKIPSTVSHQKGSIELLFYTPVASVQNGPTPVVINVHGGGFVFGNPQMDARWAGEVMKSGMVLVSVGYRRAPEHPFPTPIEDGVDAIVWVHKHAQQYNLDSTKIVLSGWSAGGTLVFSAAMKLHLEVDKTINLAGIISFYPSLDRTRTPEQRRATNPISAQKSSLPKGWREMFNESYEYPPSVDRSSPYMSPALASDDTLRDAVPKKLAIFTCSWDHLLDEGEAFRKRSQALGKEVGGSTIKDVRHAWDKMPTYGKGDAKRDQMYSEGMSQLKSMCS
jgi:acetyl esterase/lipase